MVALAFLFAMLLIVATAPARIFGWLIGLAVGRLLRGRPPPRRPRLPPERPP